MQISGTFCCYGDFERRRSGGGGGKEGGGVLIETYRTFRVHKTAFNKNGLFLLYVMLIIAHELWKQV